MHLETQANEAEIIVCNPVMEMATCTVNFKSETGRPNEGP